MADEVNHHLRANTRWDLLPEPVRKVVVSKELWQARVRDHCLEHCSRWATALVRETMKEGEYYQQLLLYQQTHLRVYPYGVASDVLRCTKTTSFQFYLDMMEGLIKQEKAYDTLPNFTARDCLRLLGIGRNQYIDLLNKCKGKGWLWNKKSSFIRDELPKRPCAFTPAGWWEVCANPDIQPDDPKRKGPKQHADMKAEESMVLHAVCSQGPVVVASFDASHVMSLFAKGLVFFAVPIQSTDIVTIPPLEGFVMNRSTNDSFERLMYRVSLSLDGNTTVQQLAQVLQEEEDTVKLAVSLYCRLGFAEKVERAQPSPNNALAPEQPASLNASPLEQLDNDDPAVGKDQRLAFVVDCNIAGLLMMGNLSPELKPHAVSLYEAGKVSATNMHVFLRELGKVEEGFGEGGMEVDALGAHEYFQQAITLFHTLKFLTASRHVDMLRVESLESLSKGACQRLLDTNYGCLLSMLHMEQPLPALQSVALPHYGPPSPDFRSPWFRLFLYTTISNGPPTMLLPMGFRLVSVPPQLQSAKAVLMSAMKGGQASVVRQSHVLRAVNHALLSSPVLLQPKQDDCDVVEVALPCQDSHLAELTDKQRAVVRALLENTRLGHTVGCLRLLCRHSDGAVWLDTVGFGVPLHSQVLNQRALDSIAKFDLLSPNTIRSHVASVGEMHNSLTAFVRAHVDWQGGEANQPRPHDNGNGNGNGSGNGEEDGEEDGRGHVLLSSLVQPGPNAKLFHGEVGGVAKSDKHNDAAAAAGAEAGGEAMARSESRPVVVAASGRGDKPQREPVSLVNDAHAIPFPQVPLFFNGRCLEVVDDPFDL